MVGDRKEAGCTDGIREWEGGARGKRNGSKTSSRLIQLQQKSHNPITRRI